MKENDELDSLKRKLIGVEIELLKLKPLNESIHQKEVKNNKSDPTQNFKSKHCKLCNLTFVQNCDLDRHIKEMHEADDEFKCDQCDKTFYLEWRYTNHKKIHYGTVKPCHFFNNGKHCLYEDIGCMFLHEESDQCKFKNCVNKLNKPFKHNRVIDEPDIIDVEDTETENFTAKENQCHLPYETANQEFIL